MAENISERVIEDILVSDKNIISELLGLRYTDLSLLARQKILSSGILDLLYIYSNELILIELKVVPFYDEIIQQINKYYNDLVILQSENKLIKSNIKKYVLTTQIKENDLKLCKKNDIILIEYDLNMVLSRYYANFREISQFMKIQSGDFGVVRLGLLNSTLKYLGNGNDLKSIADLENKSIKTIRNRLSVAIHLKLVSKLKENFYLTEIGAKFVDLNDNIDDRLSEKQKDLIFEFMKENPFYSSITYTIFTIVESVFVLSKNIYPVDIKILQDYFVKSTGKTTTWNAEKSKETATYIFSNYALELNLLSKVNNEFYITPNGIKAVLLLQLNRAIKLIDSKY